MPPRRRVVTKNVGYTKLWNAFSNSWPNNSPQGATRYASSEDHLSESHGHSYHKLGKGQGDIGGDFKVTHKEYSQGRNSDIVYNTSGSVSPTVPGHHYTGHFWARTEDMGLNSSFWPSPPVSTKVQLGALGTTAISRVAPTSPLAGLSVSLGEIREGLPSLIGTSFLKDRARRAKAAGGEYLNLEFGWKPLISDIQTYLDVSDRAEELTRKYEKNSGKLLKRRYDFPTTLETTVVDEGLKQPSPMLSLTLTSGSAGRRTMFTTTKVERWFEGAFTYYLPPFVEGGDNSKRKSQIRNYLYGTRITPDTLWNLAPWTWAADWVTNFGDVVKNVSLFNQDGLVMPYGYMMETSSRSVTWFTEGCFMKSTPWNSKRTGPFTQTFTTTVKQRVKATPFGFGLDPSVDFSGRQWAILSALGLSRGGNRLP